MAGLFDSLSDLGTDGAVQGDRAGLLARLLPFVGAVPQSSGFPGAASQQQLDQASPIAIGNYMMPRVGNAADFQPQQATLPPNAQPTQGQISQTPAPQEQQQLPPALGGNSLGGNLGAGFQNFVNAGGPLQALAGGLTGLLTGQRTDPLGMQQQNLKAQYDALVPVVGPQKALLAVLNPEAGKTILTEALTNKNEVKDVQDAFGGHHLMWVNPLKPGVAVGVGGTGAAGGQSGALDFQALTDKLSGMAQSGADRQTMLQQVPSEYRGYVDSVLSGRALPTNIGRSPARAAIMAMAHSVDPTFDESTIPLRFKTQTDYAPNGKSGQSIVALNTVQHHIGKLSDDLENIGDTGWTPLNAIRNSIATNTPLDPKQGQAIQAVNDDIKAVTDEMSAAYKAGRVSDHEIEAWQKLASSNLPVRQLRQGISDFVDLLNGKRDQLNETHQQIIGTEAPGINKDLNQAITKKVHDRNSGSGQTSSASNSGVSEGATATNPQTGQKIVFKGGQWVPMQ